MRKIQTLVLGIALGLPLLAGCHLFGPSRKDTPIDKMPTSPDKQPTTTSLVNYLNLNARQITSLQANLNIGAKMGIQAIDVSGAIAARRPRELRLRGKVLGQPAVDLGSNDQEFWYWIRQGTPHYNKCSYKDLATGKVNVPFPAETDMVMAALNMAEYDVKGKFDLKQNSKENTWELIQDTTSPAGQPVTRSTVFRGTLAKPGDPQVLEHSLRDARNNLVCKVTVQRVEVDRGSGAVIPTRLVIEYPAQKVRLKMELNDLIVNKIDDTSAKRMFSLDGLTDHSIYDLARGAVVTPSSQSRAAAETRRR